MTLKDQTIQKLNERKAVIGILGLGYVGLPLALRYAEAGYAVLGFDIDTAKPEQIAAGQSYFKHIGDERARDAVRVDAIMLVEAPIFDGEEGARNVARHLLQRQRRAGQIAAPRQQAAFTIDNLDRRRPFGDFQRLNRRQMRAHPKERADTSDAEPQAGYQGPIGQPADTPSRAARRS